MTARRRRKEEEMKLWADVAVVPCAYAERATEKKTLRLFFRHFLRKFE